MEDQDATTLELYESSSHIDTVKTSIASMTGKGRGKYENQDSVCSNVSDEYAMFFVFDGHGGRYVSNALCELAKLPHEECPFWPLTRLLDGSVAETELEDFVTKIFSSIDDRVQSYQCGSTCVIAVHHKPTNRVRFLNVGDSGACWQLQSDQSHIFDATKTGSHSLNCVQKAFYNDLKLYRTREHVPSDENEKKRVLETGYRVTYYSGCARVDGVLAVSRSFGDHSLKEAVISKPDVTPIFQFEDGDFFCLASDGIFNVYPPNILVKTMGIYKDRGAAIPGLVMNAVKEGDDSTILVVSFLKV
jgi:serine/threonine protein phosphatase PrpC